MKFSFTTLDIVCMINELRQTLLGLRVDQVYDVDKKTYLIRLVKPDVKKMLLIESGVRFHSTTFEWPKSPAPSGFTMKLRKHLSNKRLEKISQVGADRIVDFQFGTDAFAFHLFLELYDKGNLILTDGGYNILNLVRPRIQGAERLAAHETYAVEKAKQKYSISKAEVDSLVETNAGKTLREVFVSKVEFGPPLFMHVLKSFNLLPSTKIPAADNNKGIKLEDFSTNVFQALENGRNILENFSGGDIGGFIVLQQQSKFQKETQVASETQKGEEPKQPVFYDQFHPSVIQSSYDPTQVLMFPAFDATVDEYFCKIEYQKIEMKQINHEKEALKKLEKVKLDQLKRLEELKFGQDVDKRKAELITMNQAFVDAAITAIRTLVANQIPWDEIWEQIREAKENEDPIALSIVKLQLLKNQFVMSLKDPYATPGTDETMVTVEIDLGLSAYANATKFYDLKRQSAKKEERTLESQEKAFKSTEKKTLATLKEVATIHNIKKARKVLWFEKFRWFLSSENYVVLGGRDAQQNEQLVKRYLRPRDIYLHADAHGAPTVIIKNDNPGLPVLPKTLNEAGCFAVSCSGSWDSKIVTSAWWVWGDQVSKSAPTGEYLPTGSFMIRGKKNYLPPVQLVLGFGFLFRITDESLKNHVNERSRRLHSTTSESESIGKPAILPEGSTNLNVDSDKEDESEFPDTQVKIHLGTKSSGIPSQTVSTVSASTVTTFLSDDTRIALDDSEAAIVVNTGLAPNFSISVQKVQKDKKKVEKKEKSEAKAAARARTTSKNDSESQQAADALKGSLPEKPKRGQHGRNKKLREKYKDQDEEDRELRMRLLKGGETSSANASPKKSKGKGKDKGDNQPSGPKGKQNPVAKSKPSSEPQNARTALEPQVPASTNVIQVQPVEEPKEKLEDPAPEAEKVAESIEKLEITESEPIKPTETTKDEAQPIDDDEEDEGAADEVEKNILDSLTGSPTDTDELLYAIPVVAPYSTLQSYKFKIKMIPGTSKRGKAAKNALEGFLRDKSASAREKDLLKSVKDQDLARNFPGKVKLAGAQDKR